MPELHLNSHFPNVPFPNGITVSAGKWRNWICDDIRVAGRPQVSCIRVARTFARRTLSAVRSTCGSWAGMMMRRLALARSGESDSDRRDGHVTAIRGMPD